MNTTRANESAVATHVTKRTTYLKHLLTQASAAADESGLGLKALRERAQALVNERSFPHGKDEEWRFTDLSDLLNHPFQRAEKAAAVSAEIGSEIGNKLAEIDSQYKLTTLNGYFAEALSADSFSVESNGSPTGVLIAPLSKLIATSDIKVSGSDADSATDSSRRISQSLPGLLADKLAQIQGSGEVFTALNTAGFSDVMVVWVPANQVIDTPIEIIRGAVGSSISHLRTLVVAEPHAKFTLVESFTGDEQARCNTSVSEFWLADSAQVTHIRLQDEGAQTFHLAKTAVSQAANSHYHCTSIDLGAQLSRHHHEIYQTGSQTDTHLYGLSTLAASQLADTHSLIALTHPHSSATQVQKNIVDDRAHSVFNGKIYVAKAAQMANAAQLNRNLMLSKHARIDTKPELNIVADNVKCAHGATVSQLQADEMFYLQSRGISAEQAQRLLRYGFAMEIIEKIEVESLRQALSDRLNQSN
ncbi:MAG: Fe-S cluster assembly protein SufD [Phormidesmis priestleyi]|uniref:Fe-S cluster assembly protein SufD n=1 Tax=Phormidesmis priestleyi TaxID=268141 RepID=A0A2W4YVP5_9CYAN|nr:MAG: Fe-S cluster assembly protein SufD [Phormidesmis priestleyi]